MIKNIIIEGVDRLGKGTLIAGLLHQLGYMQVIHYEKPKKLDVYDGELFAYQEASFHAMFQLLESDAPILLDRAHLGEMVYSHRYRGYDGSYVLDLETLYPDACENTLLVLLTTSDFSFIKDDGQSFDFNKKEQEQADFFRAFSESGFKHKLLIDVARSGFYRPAAEILDIVVSAVERDTLESLAEDSMLLGSSTLPSTLTLRGKDYTLGDVVRAAHDASDLSVAEWNDLRPDEREQRLLDWVKEHK